MAAFTRCSDSHLRLSLDGDEEGPFAVPGWVVNPVDEVVDDAAGVEGGEDEDEEESNESDDLAVERLRWLPGCPGAKNVFVIFPSSELLKLTCFAPNGEAKDIILQIVSVQLTKRPV